MIAYFVTFSLSLRPHTAIYPSKLFWCELSSFGHNGPRCLPSLQQNTRGDCGARHHCLFLEIMIQLLKIIHRPCCGQFHVVAFLSLVKPTVEPLPSCYKESSPYIKLPTTRSAFYLEQLGHDFRKKGVFQMYFSGVVSTTGWGLFSSIIPEKRLTW